MTPAVRITAKRHGHRRCGVPHAGYAVEHAAGAFSAAQLADLEADPQLVVERIDPINGHDRDAPAQVDEPLPGEAPLPRRAKRK